jgi:hypothetical protein
LSLAHSAARGLAILVLLSPLWLAQHADAQHREFAGRVVSVSPQSITVKDRRGNAVSFARSAQTAVDGKSGWEAIAAGDQVIVGWKLGDGTARRVIVIEKPKD